MPRHKTAKYCTILPWLSCKRDCREGRFLQIGNSLFLSHSDELGTEQNAFLTLTHSARFLYLCMAMDSGGRRQFQFPLTAAKKYGINNATFRRSVRELVNAKMIIIDSGKNVRQPNNYTFSFDWKS